jgi:malate synthase
MTVMTPRAGLKIADELVRFIEERALPGTGVGVDAFWSGMADILARFAPENAALLQKREDLQAKIDAWHVARAGKPLEQAEYQAFLREIGYLVPEPAPFEVDSANIDAELASMAGPQLVVPILNARFLLNAANARWGSLYDALYGTDAIPGAASGKGYDAERGAKVIAWARGFLDTAVPGWEKALKGEEGAPPFCTFDGGYMFKHNGLHIEVVVDRDHPIGKTDPLGVADVILESALTTICDLEDSVAAVDGADKVLAYSNWLGLMKGDLEDSFEKNGAMMTRAVECGPRIYRAVRLHVHGSGPLAPVRAQCRPSDDHARRAAGGWQRSARRHHRRHRHDADRAA